MYESEWQVIDQIYSSTELTTHATCTTGSNQVMWKREIVQQDFLVIQLPFHAFLDLLPVCDSFVSMA